MEIKVLYDNEARDGFIAGWGFSCILQHQRKKILFDTGWDANVLLHNMRKLGIERNDIDIIVLSHSHWDHIGGLPSVLHQESTVFVPQSFSKRLKSEIETRAELHEVLESCEIVQNLYSTGELGEDINEQGLIVRLDKGIIVITGCAHPGLENILETANIYGDIYAVIGGFHGFDKLDLLSEIPMIMPCHCTYAKADIKRIYPNSFSACSAGTFIEL